MHQFEFATFKVNSGFTVKLTAFGVENRSGFLANSATATPEF